MTPAPEGSRGEAAADDDTLVPFSSVLKNELKEIRKRRAYPSPDDPASIPDPPPDVTKEAETTKEAEKLLYFRKLALENDLVGLCLSGGGIRSATFCLGFLQGLATHRLLRHFDYLSTVSGGGFIGGWLAAWAKREGNLCNVEKQLGPSRIGQAEAERSGIPKNRVFDDEPEPIRHLRAYSNYLAPRPGLFSADGWVLIAIYLRNLLLNQSVLLLALLALLYFMGIFLKAFVLAGKCDLAYTGPVVAICELGFLSMLLLSGAAVYRTLPTEQIGPKTSPRGAEATVGRLPQPVSRSRPAVAAPPLKLSPGLWRAVNHLHLLILGPLLAAAVVASWLLAFLLQRVEPGLTSFDWYELGLYGSAFALLHLGFSCQSVVALLPRARLRYLISIIVGLAVAAVGGVLFYLLILQLQSLSNMPAYEPPYYQWRPVLLATAGPPLLLCFFVVITFVQIGLAGSELREAVREWWSSLAGWVLMYATAWLTLFGVVYFGPYLVFEPLQKGGWVAVLAVALVWGLSVAGSLKVSKNSKTGSESFGGLTTPFGWYGTAREMVARFAPVLFLAGFLVVTSFVATTIVHRRFPTTWEQYLENLNGPTVPWSVSSSISLSPLILLGTLGMLVIYCGAAGGLASCLGRVVDVNVFSLQGLYTNRLIRCYLAASRPKERTKDRPDGAAAAGSPTGVASNSHGPERVPVALTGFDDADDLQLHQLRMGIVDIKSDLDEQPYWGPLPVINTALNLVGGEELAWQERKAESFALTPYHCGSRTTGYRVTEKYAKGPRLGTALSISGAAVSPSMGYHTAVPVSVLLTLFNARLGMWLGNPKSDVWQKPGPTSGLLYLLLEMFSRANDSGDFVYLSDGGHFENLGVYELIRRRCRFIVVCDAGADPDYTFQDLGNMIRKVRVDFGVRISIDVSALRPSAASGRAAAHIAVGKIRYGDVDSDPTLGTPPDDDDPRFDAENHKVREGVLMYLKPVLTGDETPDVENYSSAHPSFPHQATLNQFFTESQFESYRALGRHCAHQAFASSAAAVPPPAKATPAWIRKFFSDMYVRHFPPPPDIDKKFLEFNKGYIKVQAALRENDRLRFLRAELYANADGNGQARSKTSPPWRTADDRDSERLMVAEMLAVLESAWFGLQLDQYQRHPIHNGWMAIFKRWLSAPTVQQTWKELKGEFNHYFQDFVESIINPQAGNWNADPPGPP